MRLWGGEGKITGPRARGLEPPLSLPACYCSAAAPGLAHGNFIALCLSATSPGEKRIGLPQSPHDPGEKLTVTGLSSLLYLLSARGLDVHVR